MSVYLGASLSYNTDVRLVQWNRGCKSSANITRIISHTKNIGFYLKLIVGHEATIEIQINLNLCLEANIFFNE